MSNNDASTDTSRAPDPAVVYIGGFGRSGSTLVERVIQAAPQAISLGEVVHLWRRGIIGNEMCGCGTAFSDCEFWSAVGEVAFGGWDAIDVEDVLALHDAFDRQRHVWKTTRPLGAIRNGLFRYSSYYRAVYRAAAAISGAEIVVDSSKHASLAVALGNDPCIDLRVLHLVRDSVAVAYSWSKEVNYVDNGEGNRKMPRFSASRASALWMSNNALVQLVRVAGTPTCRLRYEDFVRAPSSSIRSVWGRLQLPGSYELDLTPPEGLTFPRGHSIGGNPMRFRPGAVVIRADEAWRSEMSAKERRIVKTLTFPVRASFGYVGRYA